MYDIQFATTEPYFDGRLWVNPPITEMCKKTWKKVFFLEGISRWFFDKENNIRAKKIVDSWIHLLKLNCYMSFRHSSEMKYCICMINQIVVDSGYRNECTSHQSHMFDLITQIIIRVEEYKYEAHYYVSFSIFLLFSVSKV